MSKFNPKLKNEKGLKQLPDGKWQALVKHHGHQYRQVFENKTLASQYLAKKKGEIMAGTIMPVKERRRAQREETEKAKRELDTNSLSFEKAVKLFLDHGRSTLRPRSFVNDLRITSEWLENPLFKGRLLKDITVADIQEYKQQLARKPTPHGKPTPGQTVTPRHVDHVLGRLKRLFNFMIELELIERNPVNRVKLFRKDNKRTRALTDEEESRLLEAASPAIKPLIQLALNTGVRRGELLGLRWKHVDLANRMLTVPPELAKNKKRRDIPLNDSAYGVLAARFQPSDPEELVFTTRTGGPIINLNRYWYRALERAGIKDMRWHDLRHTTASRLARAGVSLQKILEVLGHSSFEMTLWYAHLTPNDLRDDLKKIG